MKPRVLVIDDDVAVLQSCETILEDAGYEAHGAERPEDGLALLKRERFDLALIDFKLPGMNGFEVLEQASQADPGLVLIMFTGYATLEAAVEAVKRGAFNYIAKPFTSGQLLDVVGKGLERSRTMRERTPAGEKLRQCCPPYQIVGRSAKLAEVLDTVAKVSACDANVLVTGASGTGKELIARAIHANSGRRDQPFVPVDCAALPASLLESELFGYDKGAFTGALQCKRGLLEAADHGTVFFDEIGEMNAELQAKMLRVLQERSFRRLGSERLINVDVRVICSTNRDLQAEAQAGRFRPDLLYRLNVVAITLPPLRERNGDLLLLTEHFIQGFARSANRGKVQISPEAMRRLEEYAWPGNVRELRNVIERAVVLCDDGLIRSRDLPEHIRGGAPAAPTEGYKAARHQWVDANGKQYVMALLRKHGGNISAAAREAQISRKSLYELLRRLDIDMRQLESSAVTPA